MPALTYVDYIPYPVWQLIFDALFLVIKIMIGT